MPPGTRLVGCSGVCAWVDGTRDYIWEDAKILSRAANGVHVKSWFILHTW